MAKKAFVIKLNKKIADNVDYEDGQVSPIKDLSGLMPKGIGKLKFFPDIINDTDFDIGALTDKIKITKYGQRSCACVYGTDYVNVSGTIEPFSTFRLAVFANNDNATSSAVLYLFDLYYDTSASPAIWKKQVKSVITDVYSSVLGYRPISIIGIDGDLYLSQPNHTETEVYKYINESQVKDSVGTLEDFDEFRLESGNLMKPYDPLLVRLQATPSGGSSTNTKFVYDSADDSAGEAHWWFDLDDGSTDYYYYAFVKDEAECRLIKQNDNSGSEIEVATAFTNSLAGKTLNFAIKKNFNSQHLGVGLNYSLESGGDIESGVYFVGVSAIYANGEESPIRQAAGYFETDDAYNSIKLNIGMISDDVSNMVGDDDIIEKVKGYNIYFRVKGGESWIWVVGFSKTYKSDGSIAIGFKTDIDADYEQGTTNELEITGITDEGSHLVYLLSLDEGITITSLGDWKYDLLNGCSTDKKVEKIAYGVSCMTSGGFYIANININGRYYSDRIMRSLSVSKPNSFSLDDYIDIGVNDGDMISALAFYDNKLFVFKHHSIVIYDTSGDFEKMITVIRGYGVKINYNVTVAKDGVYFVNDKGLFKITETLDVTNVSYGIRNKWLDLNMDAYSLMLGFNPADKTVICYYQNTLKTSLFVYDIVQQFMSYINSSSLITGEISNLVMFNDNVYFVKELEQQPLYCLDMDNTVANEFTLETQYLKLNQIDGDFKDKVLQIIIYGENIDYSSITVSVTDDNGNVETYSDKSGSSSNRGVFAPSGGYSNSIVSNKVKINVSQTSGANDDQVLDKIEIIYRTMGV